MCWLPCENKGDFQKLIPREFWGEEEPSDPGAVRFIPSFHSLWALVASTYAAASFHWGVCQEWVPVLFFCLIHLFVYPSLATHPSIQSTYIRCCSPAHRSEYSTQAVDAYWIRHSALCLISVGSGSASLSGPRDRSLPCGWSSIIWIGASTFFCSPSGLVSHSFRTSKKDRWST